MASRYIPYLHATASPKTFMVLAGVCLLAAWGLLVSQLLFSNLLACVLLFIAFINAKLALNQHRQPRFALVLCEDHLQYHHRHGGWSIPWQQLQSLAIPRLIQHGDYQDSHYLGLRLNNLESIVEQLNPRFISQILTEQRAILRFALASESHQLDIQEHLFESDYYKCQNGHILTGLKAMFAHRMRVLQSLTGYHLWIDLNDIDIPKSELLKLGRDYWQSAPSIGNYAA